MQELDHKNRFNVEKKFYKCGGEGERVELT
jgi:hypothetical protein